MYFIITNLAYMFKRMSDHLRFEIEVQPPDRRVQLHHQPLHVRLVMAEPSEPTADLSTSEVVVLVVNQRSL